MTDLAKLAASLPFEKRMLLVEQLKQNGSRLNCFPLSYAQRRLWFLEQLEPGSPSYNIPLVVSVDGRFDVAAAEESLNEIVRRHETLRTTFTSIEGHPFQIVGRAEPLSLAVIDLCELPEVNREREAMRLATEETRKPFALDCGPLVRARFFKLSPERNIALMVIHHIVSDGWSVGVLLREFASLYQAITEGKPNPLKPFQVQYADYACWQQQWMLGGEPEKDLAYWRRQLGGDLPVLELPTDYPRPQIMTYEGARERVILPRELSESLRRLSKRQGVTLFMTVLTAYAVMLHHNSEQLCILIGTSVSGRNLKDTEGLIGCLLNQIALRVDLSGDLTFIELLARVRRMTIESFAHQALPFDIAVERLQPKRDLSRTPVFQAMFVLQNTPMGAMEFAGLSLKPLEIDSGASRFDLTLDLSDRPEGLAGWLEYKTILFNVQTIARMEKHFQTILSKVVAQPGLRLSELRKALEQQDRQQEVNKGARLHELSRLKLRHETTGRRRSRAQRPEARTGTGPRIS